MKLVTCVPISGLPEIVFCERRVFHARRLGDAKLSSRKAAPVDFELPALTLSLGSAPPPPITSAVAEGDFGQNEPEFHE
jgi:hypothetical protein